MRMKRWIISVLSVLLIGVTVLVAAFEVAEDKNTGELDLLICVESDGRPEYLRPWKNENGDFYVFLPGYAQLDAVSLICERGTAIIDGMEPSRKEPFALNRAYSIAESADGEMGGVQSPF